MGRGARRRSKLDGGPIVLVSRPDGPVVGGNAAARDLFGHPSGEACWSRLKSLDAAEGLPCHEGCTAKLTAGAQEQHHCVRWNSESYELSCTPVNGKVVSVLAPGVSPEAAESEPLTPREHDVLRLLVEGMNSAQIGKELGIGAGTVRSHVEHLRAKLEAPTRAAIVGRAFRLGYIR